MGRLVAGFGVNDVDYVISYCPYYSVWHSMVKRCYLLTQRRADSYYGVASVCEEWKYFSNFKSWMEKQDWRGKHLDKDLKVVGNKVYSPDTCLFITNQVNQFLKTNSGRSLQEGMPTGVRWKKQNKKYVAGIRDFRTGKTTHIGYYDKVEDAESAYKYKKLELATAMARLDDNLNIAEYLLKHYSITV